jgi:glycosyltransferase involved in cell wall biosynthesis
MKIVLVNYRYFISGGPERYMFNITETLEKKGHTVVPFSIKHNKNAVSPYENYFLEPIGSGDETYANEYKKGDVKTVFKVLGRMLYSFEAKRKFTRLLQDVKPDLVYILHYQNKISASIIDAAYQLKIPIVQRISDFGHICVNNTFYQPKENAVCERCLQGSRMNAIIHKCADGSLVNSCIKVAALTIQDFRHTREKISAFCIPALFTISKFIEYGVPADKIHHLPTFFNGLVMNEAVTYDNYFLYVGRVVPDKGLFTLVRAFENTKHKLIIIGSSGDGYDIFLKNYLAGKEHHITFLGTQAFPVIKGYLKDCLATICPSEWYENIPNSILESFAFKKAVIASNIGSLKELIVPGDTGLFFPAGDFEALRSCVDTFSNDIPEAVRMGANAQQKLVEDYSESVHYEKLMHVFNSIRAN